MKLLFMRLLITFPKWVTSLIFRLDNQLVVNVFIIEESFFEFVVLEFFFLLFFDLSSISRQSFIIKASLFKVLRLSELGRVLFKSLLRRDLSRLRE